MIKFTPKEKPSNRITDVTQLENGQTYLIAVSPYIYLEEDEHCYFLDLQGYNRRNPGYLVQNYTVIQADFEITEL